MAEHRAEPTPESSVDTAEGATGEPTALTVLYSGAEVDTPGGLAELIGTSVVSSPRALAPFIEQAASRRVPLVVIPAGTGRDLTSVTQAAQALQWAQRSGAQVVLGPTLIDATRVIAELRQHLRLATGRDAVLFLARAVDPFADAELLRRVRLARQFSEDLEVEVAFEGSWPTPERARERLRLLGAETVTEVRADLAVGGDITAAPLFRSSALVTAVERAQRTALHLLEEHHDDGIAAGLLADHATGFAHSHGEDGGHSHGHGHHHSDSYHSAPHNHPHHH